MAVAEAIVVCIDNSKAMVFSDNYQDQLDAIKLYCQAKFDANPECEVALFLMGSPKFRFLISRPTSDLQKILDCIPYIHYDPSWLSFAQAARHARCAFEFTSPKKQKRMLFFVGGLTDLTNKKADTYGKKLKDVGIAVDVVTFHLKEDPKLMGEIRFGRVQLDAFVKAANHDNNSQIVHLNPGDSVLDVLSETILEKTLRHPRKVPISNSGTGGCLSSLLVERKVHISNSGTGGGLASLLVESKVPVLFPGWRVNIASLLQTCAK